jgi:hypothetical protein
MKRERQVWRGGGDDWDRPWGFHNLGTAVVRAALHLYLDSRKAKMKTASQLAVLVLATFNLSAATLYVSLESTNPVAPYATWATAATNIQDAVDAGRAGDTVLVTNGVYAVGSREVSVLDTNQEPPQLVSNGQSRVVVTNPIR